MGTFSESWYRIRDRRIALRPQARVRRQFFRGEKWYVVEDPFNNQFFRIRPEAWAFLSRLGPRQTVGEVWQACLERDAEGTPGQEEVIQLLAQLYHANLLQYHVPTDAVALFDRYTRRRQQEIRSRLMSIMYSRIPLVDPDGFLRRTLPIFGWLFSLPGLLVWAGVLALALMEVVGDWSAFVDQGQAVLAPGNLPLLYAALVGIKVVHEFGHAYACRRYGGEVHVMGVMLLIFTPIPYVDATASWAFRSRWKRAAVGAAGMYVELLAAAFAALVWANVGDGPVRALAYNLIFIASVSTLLFNINPLLRFDGYYILSDLLDIPNLHSRSAGLLRHGVERYGFGYRRSVSPARSRREAFWLAGFACASGVYRVFVFGVILLFVADQFLLLGILMAAVCVVTWGVLPVGRLIQYLLTSPRLDRTRGRAIGVCLGSAVVLTAALGVVPAPHHFRAPGVVLAADRGEVVPGVGGRLVEVLVEPGRHVGRGEPLLRLENPGLEHELLAARAQLEQVEALHLQALQDRSADVAPILENREAVLRRLDRLQEQRRALRVRARISGTWEAPDLHAREGSTVARGTRLGTLVDERSFRFTAVVRQQKASRLFEQTIRGAEIRLRGQPARPLPADEFAWLPMDRGRLPDASLGWSAGGPVEVDPGDPEGRTATEPFFEVRTKLPAGAEEVYRHGLSGVMRFELPPEPLLRQWGRALRQLLQERYGW